MIWLYIVMLIPVGFWTLIAIGASLALMTLHKARLVPIPSAEAEELLEKAIGRAGIDQQWAQEHSLHPLGVYTLEGVFATPKLVVWEHDTEATWLVCYLFSDGQCQLDFVTSLDQANLTTGTTKDGHFFPLLPHHYMQSFDCDDAASLYQHHVTGLDYLRDRFQAAPQHPAPNFETTLLQELKDQQQFIFSLKLYFLRIPWWYFTRRSARHNKTLEELHGPAF